MKKAATIFLVCVSLTFCAYIFIVGLAHAQTVYQDSDGTQGMVIPNGPSMGMWQDNKGNSGTYQSLGRQGIYQDSRGRQGQWMDIGPNQRSFSDNQGGQGQMFQNGPNMGQFNYQQNGQMQQGQFRQFGR